jgi:hypothetical protein
LLEADEEIFKPIEGDRREEYDARRRRFRQELNNLDKYIKEYGLEGTLDAIEDLIDDAMMEPIMGITHKILEEAGLVEPDGDMFSDEHYEIARGLVTDRLTKKLIERLAQSV